MGRAFNENIRAAQGLAGELLRLAEKGDAERNDESCGLLYAEVRRSAQRIRELADKEETGHRAKGKWD